MIRKNSSIWRNAISSASALTLIFSGLMFQSAEAVTSNPVPVCVGASCTVTFEYSGDNYLWAPPASVTSISFDIQGAQGGVTGGKGGRVTGTLSSVPAELYIFVGGVGQRGSSAAGGFNGGGSAGLGFGDEGSGGGATDIRTSTAISSRVVIAAGGGGSGGAIGGAGGSGGGLQGLAGRAARTEGGAGGTATVGGNGGLPYGGTSGTKGALGLGGNGGSSSYSGGGGGGGGLYGGGGGGATLDTCCYGSGAGGGAGGSSFASASVVTEPVHSTGVRSGSGLAVISYFLPPEVVTFASATTITKQDALVFNLGFNQDVSGLVSTDFSQPDNPCATLAVAGSASSYTVTLSGCPDGSHRLGLASNSVSGSGAGPAQAFTSNSVTLDSVAPSALIVAPTSPANSATPRFSLTFSEPISGFDAADLSVTGAGCVFDAISGSGLTLSATLKACENAASAQITVAANSFTDAAGNLGPVQQVDSASVRIDHEAPAGNWVAASLATTYVDPSFELSFAEPTVGLQAADFEQIGTAVGCVLNLTELTSGTRYSVATSGCGFGSVQVALGSGSFTDVATNPGTASQSGSIIFAAAPVVTPPPAADNSVAPSAAPVAEVVTQPIAEPSVQPSAQPTAEPVAEPVAEVQAQPVAESSAELVAPLVAESVAVVKVLKVPRVKVTEAQTPVADLAEPTVIAEPIEVTPPIQTVAAVRTGSQSVDFAGLAYVAIGLLGAAAVTLGAVNSVKNLRLRRRVLPS